MKHFTANIQLPMSRKLYNVLLPDIKSFNTNRGNININKDDKIMLLEITAYDLTMFRTILTSIARALSVYDEVSMLKTK